MFSLLVNFNSSQANRVSSLGEVRHIPIGGTTPHAKYPNNKLVSAKYTVWTFLPLNMFEQFRRIANFYFLVATIIVMCINSPVSPWTSLLPLLFVVMVTAAKQGYEDFLRHRSDREVNLSPVSVIRNGVSQELTAEQIEVGDLVLVNCDQDVPCDMVLVASSHCNSRCYVTTANLDGESNLKTVCLPAPLRNVRSANQLLSVRGFVECEQPHPDLYRFYGRLELSQAVPAPPPSPTAGRSSSSQRISIDSITARFSQVLEPQDEEEALAAPLSAEHLLLKGARLRNTEYVFGCAVYTGRDTKMARNSVITRNKFSSMEKSINRLLLYAMTCLIVLVITSVVGSTYYKKSEGIAKANSAYLGEYEDLETGEIINEILSYLILYNYLIPISLYVTIEMQKFLGSLFFMWDNQMYCIDSNRTAVCNSSDMNEELGLVEYLFTDKTGTLTENAMVFRRCCINGVPYHEVRGVLRETDADPRAGDPVQALTPGMEHFFLALALCHSSQMDYEERFDVLDGAEFQYESSSPDERALLQACARCGVVFLGESSGYYVVRARGRVSAYRRLEVLEFTSERKRMSVIVRDPSNQIWLFCKGAESTVLPLVTHGQKTRTIDCMQEFAMRGLRTMLVACRRIPREEYYAAMQAVRDARCTMAGDRESQISSACLGVERDLTLLGATAVEDRLQPGVREALANLRDAGIKVSGEALRGLCCARQTSRPALVNSRITLLHIQTWILTGDKVETAISISYASRHFQLESELLFVTEHTSAAVVTRTLRVLRDRLASGDNYGLVVDGESLALALQHAPDLLLEVGLACPAVVCCRLSPLQKCQVVRLIKNSPSRPTTAAIGDGANDVSMIQEAHVGLGKDRVVIKRWTPQWTSFGSPRDARARVLSGLMGKEGRQAERCSDFAVARFRFVQRALLVHGHWYYYRLAILVHYFFYKNVVFVLPQFYFILFTGFSPQASQLVRNSMYTSVFLTCFNIIFTSAPVLVYGLLEQNRPSYQLLQYPPLYKGHQGNKLMRTSHFLEWLMAGIWHSVVVFFVPVLALHCNTVLLENGSETDMLCLSTLVYSSAVLVVNFKLLLISKYWTLPFLLSIIISLLLLHIINLIYAVIDIDKLINQQMFYVYIELISSPLFWLFTLFSIWMALLPDIIIIVISNFKKARRDPTFKFTSTVSNAFFTTQIEKPG
ncbi:putative phospholipid-transporting ATPase IF [Frankliniella fusca]|uniref:Phospholipid-transporting ATPase IF n=1 Tax=Frankliniella fusca TaxID=407009 RepID=A0AAE1HSP1_9NEOP|nr:putative phospholipid-transporting ATPase IF [Frankliniella fusca]